MLGPKKRIQKQFKVQKMRNYKNFGSKHFELKFKVKKNWIQIFGPKILNPKQLGSRKYLSLKKKIKKFGSKTILG